MVDDDQDIRDSLYVALTDQGYTVITVPDGAHALQALETHGEPSLILLDLIMPGMDGPMLLDRLRADPRFANIPVTILSAGSICPPPDGYPFLRKPVSLEALLAAVAEHCGPLAGRRGGS